MDIWEAIKVRHSVRKYLDKPLDEVTAEVLEMGLEEVRGESGLKLRLFLNEPEVFSGTLVPCGQFRGCKNYLVIAGPPKSEELVGYYGEKLVLMMQQLGLNTCWVVSTYKKGKVQVFWDKGEKLQAVIALGYGENQGVPHKSKPLESRCKVEGPMPDWFREGMEAAMLAPTAINQQQFMLTLMDRDVVKAKALPGFYSRMDLGIVKCHFELGAGGHPFLWAQEDQQEDALADDFS